MIWFVIWFEIVNQNLLFSFIGAFCLAIAQSSISMEEATEILKAKAKEYGLDKNSVELPPKELLQQCRKECKILKAGGQLDLLEVIRDEFPSGMTGTSISDRKY